MVTFKLIRYLQLFAAIEVCLVSSATSSQWLSIALSSTVQTFKTKGSCDKIGDQLNNRQVQVCKRNVDFMNSVKMGATLAVQECQHQFRYRRWNCTTVQFEKSPVFGNSVNGGTREAAFVHSISSAGVAFAVTHACSAGKFGRKCGCDGQYKGVSDEGFKWAGCSDDIDFGIEFSKSFVDARERGRKVGKHARVLMNLHNNEAGRQAVKRYMKLQCKCHGVSGSCNVRTCWRTLPNFRQVGDHIKEKFDGATEVEDKLIGSRRVLVPKNRNFKPHTIEDLVYIDKSPDFCAANPNTGSLGTQGRFCNRTSQAIDGCELMCCGRGYSTHMETRTERCECKFFWCCYVRCRECQKRVEVSICK